MNVENGGGEAVETSLRDDLRAAWEAASVEDTGAGASPEPADGGGEAAPEPFVAADGATPEPRADGRDEQGRFTAKPKEGDPADAQPEQQAAADPAAAQPQAAPAADDQAPASWRPVAKDKWAAIDPAVRAEILKREKDISRTVSVMDDERKYAREMADVIRPHGEMMERLGVTSQVAARELFADAALMRSTKAEDLPRKVDRFYELMEVAGLDHRAFANPRPGAHADPGMRAMQREIAGLHQRLAAPAQPQEFAPLPSQTPNDTIRSDIETFRTDPANVHFDQVAPMMVTLIESGHASSLADAYGKAVLASGLAQQPPVAQQPTPSLDAAASKAAAARRASPSVTRSPGPSGSPAPMTMRDELRENLRRLTS